MRTFRMAPRTDALASWAPTPASETAFGLPIGAISVGQVQHFGSHLGGPQRDLCGGHHRAPQLGAAGCALLVRFPGEASRRHHRLVGGGILLGQALQQLQARNGAVTQLAQRLLVGCRIGPADGQLGDHRHQRGAHGAGERGGRATARYRLAAGEAGGQLVEGKPCQLGGLRVSCARIGRAVGAVPSRLAAQIVRARLAAHG